MSKLKSIYSKISKPQYNEYFTKIQKLSNKIAYEIGYWKIFYFDNIDLKIPLKDRQIKYLDIEHGINYKYDH